MRANDASSVAAVAGGARRPTPVLYVHHGLNWITGSERCMLDLVGCVDRSRFTPIVWCDAPMVLAAAETLGAVVYRADDWAADAAFLPRRGRLRQARAIVRRHGVGLIHANDTEPLRTLVPVARSERIPVVAHLHLLLSPDERRWSWLHQVSLAVGVSEAAVAGLREDGLPADRIAVIANGVDPARLAAGDARALRAALGIPAGDVVFVVVASLIARKGIDVVVHALAELCERRGDCHLLVCGDGPLDGELRSLAARAGVADRAHFLGRRPDVGAILRDAGDVLVSAAWEESFGLGVAEAAVLGVPAIASAVDGHREIVSDGEGGLLFPPGDVAALAAAMEALAADPARRRALGDGARRRAERSFLVSRYVAAFEEAYERVLRRPRSRYGWRGGWFWPAAYTRWAADIAKRRLARLRPTRAPWRGARAVASAP